MHIFTQTSKLKAFVVGIVVSATMSVSIMPATAAVTFYKSIGPHGEVRYSQFPPRDTADFETISMRSDGRQDNAGELSGKTNKAVPTAPTTAVDQQMQALEERIKRQEELDQARQCQTLRNNLTQLNIGGQVYEMVDGNKVYLNESQINQKRETIKQALSQYCSGQPT